MGKITILGVVGFLFLSSFLLGQDHPGKEVKKEGTYGEVSTAISDYIEQDEMLKGRFMIYDEKNDIVRLLKLETLHGVNQLETGNYVVCVDFEDQNENILDIDFYIDTDSENGSLEVSNLEIHTINGESL